MHPTTINLFHVKHPAFHLHNHIKLRFPSKDAHSTSTHQPHTRHTGITFLTEPALLKPGPRVELTPKPSLEILARIKENANKLVVKSRQERFDVSQIAKNGRIPIPISGRLATPPLKDIEVGILDMLIKPPESPILLPHCLIDLAPMIETIASFEQALNPYYNQWYMSLTVDKRPIKAGSTQRSPGAHIDGMQGSRITDTPISSFYIWMNSAPTEGQLTGVDLTKLNTKEEDAFIEMQRHWNPNTVHKLGTHQIYRLDAYTIHRAAKVLKDCERTFIRVGFSPYIFDRLGNSINPCIKTPIKSVVRGDPTDLRHTINFDTPQQFKNLYELFSEHSSPIYRVSGLNLLKKLRNQPYPFITELLALYWNDIENFKKEECNTQVVEQIEKTIATLKWHVSNDCEEIRFI